ncbi:MAG: hypothetical protein KF685_02985 [Acidobacteria bacterium]|nr:hypothetical protein [Acidobacteriota bacterium]
MRTRLEENTEIEQLQADAVDAEIIETEAVPPAALPPASVSVQMAERQRLYLRYIFLPVVFLTSALLGGLRLSGADGAFIFLKPSLMCLIFAVILLALFFRAGLISVDGWFSENFPVLKNIANGTVILSLYAASVQLFNSLIPEQGLPFWIVAFCFFWTLWNNLFADFDVRRLLRSLGALFGLAFVVKYMLLANLTAPAEQNWLRSIIENPAQGAFTWLLDLPQFSPGTGYIQFFAVGLYLFGLFLLPSTTQTEK